MPNDGKFKYDICRVIGHENTVGGFCERCEFDIFAAELKERLENQFLGRKVTADLIVQIECSAREILFKQIDKGTIKDFRNLKVVKADDRGPFQHYLDVDALNSAGMWIRTQFLI